MLVRVTSLLFVVLMTNTAFSSNAVAEIECERKTNSTSGFKDAKAHDWWFPKVIYFETKHAEPKGSNRLTFSEGYLKTSEGWFNLPPKTIWEMLPNGQLFGKFAGNQRSGYKQITPRKYVCSMNVSEILAKKAADSSNPGQRSSSQSISNAATSGTAPQQTKLEQAKTECSDLGFERGTERHGDCVLKLLDSL